MDAQRYGELLALHQPVVIETPEEHDHMLSLAESLMEKGELGPEEEKLLSMCVLLIEAFEASILQGEEGDEDEENEPPAEPPAPHEVLQRMLEARGLELMDVAPLFGTPGIAREVLDGKRPISRAQSRELGKYFGMPAKLFQV